MGLHLLVSVVPEATAIEVLKANKVFHIATVDGARARVRPFSFVMKRNNTLYFCTNKSKDVYKQMFQNPDVEISSMGTDGTWLRVEEESPSTRPAIQKRRFSWRPRIF